MKLTHEECQFQELMEFREKRNVNTKNSQVQQIYLFIVLFGGLSWWSLMASNKVNQWRCSPHAMLFMSLQLCFSRQLSQWSMVVNRDMVFSGRQSQQSLVTHHTLLQCFLFSHFMVLGTNLLIFRIIIQFNDKNLYVYGFIDIPTQHPLITYLSTNVLIDVSITIYPSITHCSNY